MGMFFHAPEPGEEGPLWLLGEEMARLAALRPPPDPVEHVRYGHCAGCFGLMAQHRARGKYARICRDCVGNEIMK